MYPGAPTPPSHPRSANHLHPCHPSGHVCSPAPEPRNPPKTNAPPTSRAAALHPDRPENIKGGGFEELRQPQPRRNRQRPSRLKHRQVGDQKAPGWGKGKGRSGTQPRPAPPVPATGGSTTSEPPSLLPTFPPEAPLIRPTTATGATGERPPTDARPPERGVDPPPSPPRMGPREARPCRTPSSRSRGGRPDRTPGRARTSTTSATPPALPTDPRQCRPPAAPAGLSPRLRTGRRRQIQPDWTGTAPHEPPEGRSSASTAQPPRHRRAPTPPASRPAALPPRPAHSAAPRWIRSTPRRRRQTGRRKPPPPPRPTRLRPAAHAGGGEEGEEGRSREGPGKKRPAQPPWGGGADEREGGVARPIPLFLGQVRKHHGIASLM